jgi:hypothetical protein
VAMLSCQNIRTTRCADGIHTETVLENHAAVCETVEVRGLVNPTAITADSM